MNLNHLYIFYQVARQGHFTRAAGRLFISQPAVSKQVKELERELGLPLFEANTHKQVKLTAVGQTVFEYAGRIFGLVEEVEQVVDDLKGLRQGRLAVGATTTVGMYILPEVLGRYKTRYPGLEFFLDIANNEQIQQKVVAGRLELGLVEGFVEGPELAALTWQTDDIALIAAPLHPLASRTRQGEPVTLAEASRYDLFVREAGSGTREVTERALEDHGLKWRPAMELGSTEAIKKMVAAGLGLAFVSCHTLTLEEKVGALVRVPLADFSLQRTLWLVYRPGCHFSPAAQALLEMLSIPPLSG